MTDSVPIFYLIFAGALLAIFVYLWWSERRERSRSASIRTDETDQRIQEVRDRDNLLLKQLDEERSIRKDLLDSERKARSELSTIQQEIGERALRLLEVWKRQEKEDAVKEIKASAIAEAQNELATWKIEHEEQIRNDAIKHHLASVGGKVAEHFAPYLAEFPYNPKDARFLGSPIDFVVFAGLDEGEVRKVVFAEIKRKTSRLSEREKQVKAAIRHGRVEWIELRIDETPNDDGSPHARVVRAVTKVRRRRELA
jgi:predicted Holliday junction resolvase-like endonuclease